MKFIQVGICKFLNLKDVWYISGFKRTDKTWKFTIWSNYNENDEIFYLDSHYKGLEINEEIADNVIRVIINALYLFEEDKTQIIFNRSSFKNACEDYLNNNINTKGFPRE